MTRVLRDRINHKPKSSSADLGKAASEISELLDIDRNQNKRTRIRSLDGNTMISPRTRSSSGKDILLDSVHINNILQGFFCKRSRTRGTMPHDSFIGHELPEDTSMKSTPLERNAYMLPTAKVSSKTSSEIMHCDATLGQSSQKKKRRNQRDQNVLKSNDIHDHHPDGTSSTNNTPLERNSFPQLLVNTCLKADSEMTQHGVELSLSEDMNKGKQQNKSHNALESNDNSHDLQVGGGRPSLDVTDIKSTCNVDVNSFSEVAEHLSSSPNCVDSCSMKKHEDLASNNNVLHEVGSIKMYQTRKQVKFYCRKRGKVLDCLVNTLEPNEGADSSVLVVQGRRRSTSLDCSNEAPVSVCLQRMLEREVLAGHGTSLKVEEDTLVEKPLGVCSDLDHASGESQSRFVMEKSKETINEDSFAKDVSVADLRGENFEQAKRTKLNVKQNVVSDVYPAEEKLEESTRFSKEDKASCDASCQDPPGEPLDQKRQSKMADTINPLSELDAIKDNAAQVINKEHHTPQVLQSSLGRALSGCFRRKLLVLDVNGLLADLIANVPDGYEADTMIGQKAVFKRPFCDHFLQFCFERFNVGVWSSRTRRNVQLVLDFLMGKTRHNLLFCWDQSHCTETGFTTVENRNKPLVLKELKRLWEKHEPNLPWERGEYNESNTLLLDDSPYKALCNPPNTAIFPHTYRFKDVKDNSLGPGGDLRVYLEGLALAENVQKYVEQNPFGQRSITKTNLSWRYYEKVIASTSSQVENDASNSSAYQWCTSQNDRNDS